MSRGFLKFVWLLLLVLPATLFIAHNGRNGLSLAEDSVEGEDDDAIVETETAGEEEATDDSGLTDTGKEGEEEEESESEDDQTLKPSPDADTFIYFTKPANPQAMPAGKHVRILVGFTNKGKLDFIVESMEAAFRYPQDYSFYLQNFTTVTFNSVIEPKRQGTFEYGFLPGEAFSSRPFGLTVVLNYKDSEGKAFQSAVFNETIQVVEPDDGLDGETFFLYVFLAAFLILLLVGAQQLFVNYGRKRISKPRQTVELGTQNSDIDYDWIPKETLQQGLKKSPKRTPKKSPRQRRNLRSTGSGEE